MLPKIINEDQNGYVKSRYIGYNLRLMEDILHYNNKSESNCLITSCDFEKAFDSIEISYIDNALKFFNFGTNFRTWIKTLYHQPMLRIKNNGWFTKPINMRRGVKQGCPISSLHWMRKLNTTKCQ